MKKELKTGTVPNQLQDGWNTGNGKCGYEVFSGV
jgi:hypothetical protein